MPRPLAGRKQGRGAFEIVTILRNLAALAIWFAPGRVLR